MAQSSITKVSRRSINLGYLSIGAVVTIGGLIIMYLSMTYIRLSGTLGLSIPMEMRVLPNRKVPLGSVSTLTISTYHVTDLFFIISHHVMRNIPQIARNVNGVTVKAMIETLSKQLRSHQVNDCGSTSWLKWLNAR